MFLQLADPRGFLLSKNATSSNPLPSIFFHKLPDSLEMDKAQKTLSSPGCGRGQGQSTARGHHSPSLMGSTRSLMATGQVPTCLPNAFISPCPDFSSVLTNQTVRQFGPLALSPQRVYAPSDARLTLTCLLGSFIHTTQSRHSELRDLRSRLPFLVFPSFCLPFPLQFSPLR